MSNRAINRLFERVALKRANIEAMLAAWDRVDALLFVVDDDKNTGTNARRWRTITPGNSQYNLTYWDGKGSSGHMGFYESQLHEAVSYALAGGGRKATRVERAEFDALVAAGQA